MRRRTIPTPEIRQRRYGFQPITTLTLVDLAKGLTPMHIVGMPGTEGLPKNEDRPNSAIRTTCRRCGYRETYLCTDEEYERFTNGESATECLLALDAKTQVFMDTKLCPSCRKQMGDAG